MPPNGHKRDSTWPMSPRSSIRCVQNDCWAYGMFGANPAPILHRHWHCLQMDQNEIPQDPCHLVIPSSASKTFSKPTVCLAQTVHLSYTDTSTISKWTKTRFHMTHFTLEFHRVHLKWFLRLWYVQRKPYNTYLVSSLALSPNGLNWASTWGSVPWSTIGCFQNNFGAYGTFDANRAPILHYTCTVSKRTKTRFYMNHVT
jgi:hypothetical protein